MCGRFTLHHSTEEVIDRFGVQETLFELTPRFNIAPTQQIAVVCQGVNQGANQGANQEAKRILTNYKWGLVPSWASDPQIGSKMINARAETLAEKPSFKKSLLTKRCLIPSDGFYEWQQEGKNKNPVYIQMKNQGLFAFAGLWDEWKSPDNTLLRTCTIITVEPNSLISKIHHRMAAILTKELENMWLDPSLKELDKLLEMLKPYSADEMEVFPVNKAVNNTSFDSPECIKPGVVERVPIQETLW